MTRAFNSNTKCGQASTLEAKDSGYCRESRELLVKEHLTNLFAKYSRRGSPEQPHSQVLSTSFICLQARLKS